MNSLSATLKKVIIDRLQKADSNEILEITSQLCANEEPTAFEFTSRSSQRFTSTDAMVEDMTTGLIWSAADVGERHTWADAKKAVAQLTLGGLQDWRLPTIKELLTLVDYDQHSPAIDKSVFPTCKADWYWTSTPYARSPGDYAWSVSFYGGFSYYGDHDNGGLVRAVRSRQ